MVLVRFPFTAGTATKQRPGLVVSSDQYNRSSPDLMIASITSNLAVGPHQGDHRIVHWQAAGLLKPSLAQAKIATIEQGLIQRWLGRLAADDWNAIESGLRLALGLG